MATLFMDNFEIYGVEAALIDGMYADTVGMIPTVLDETYAIISDAPLTVNNYVRKVLPATYTTIFAAGRVRMNTLPTVSDRSASFMLLDVANDAILSYSFDTTGRIVIRRGGLSGTEIGRSVSPVILANTWHHIEGKFVIDGATGSVEIYIDDSDIPAINLTNVNTSGTGLPVAQVRYGNQGGFSSAGLTTYWTDVHVWDTTGTRNTDFLGDVAVSTLWPNVDVQTGWTPNYRHKIGDGVLSTYNTTEGFGGTIQTDVALSCADSANFELGTGDFTLETFIRFHDLPTLSNRVGIINKWYESSNQRSYELSKCGPGLNSGNIEFRVSTAGTAGTISTIISQPWEPETDTWYHLAVVRASGETMLFIDGIMQGVPQADANNYFSGTAPFGFGGSLSPDGSTPVTGANTSVHGWFDETRITQGVARYTENFTPTTVEFPRTVGGDPDFASVVLLMGYDIAIVDESSFARTVTGRSRFNSPSVIPTADFPDDGTDQYQTINAQDTLSFGPPRDDTNISASLYHADAILTLDDNPANTETVTIGAQAYTFKTVLASAYDVLIGATIEDTLSNFIAAVNQDTGEGTLYGTGTVANTEVYGEELPSPQCKVIALVAGTAGNSITVAETVDGTWDNATLTGGADIPGPSSFRMTRMPPGVTSIRSIMAVTRAYKTESGPAKMKTNFVGPSGTITEGTEVSLSTEPSYRIEVFEADPDTSGPITPATLVEGRIQFDRTE